LYVVAVGVVNSVAADVYVVNSADLDDVYVVNGVVVADTDDVNVVVVVVARTDAIFNGVVACTDDTDDNNDVVIWIAGTDGVNDVVGKIWPQSMSPNN